MKQQLLEASGWSFGMTLMVVMILGAWAILLAPVWTVLVILTQKAR